MKFPKYEELSAEQLNVVNFPLNGKYLVFGPPGSGKTIIAAFRLKRTHQTLIRAEDKIAKSKYISTYSKRNVVPKKKCLFLVFNRTLRQYIIDNSKDAFLTFEITTWPAWLHSIYSRELLNNEHIKDFKYNWSEIDDSLKKIRMVNYEYVIIDEGQDMPLPLLRIINKYSNNLFYFADHNQSIIDQKPELKEITNSVKDINRIFHLTSNFRNTRQIYDVAELILEVHQVNPPILEGPKPILLKTHEAKLIDIIVNHAKENSNSKIGVLVPSFKAKTTNRLDNLYAKIKKKFKSVQRYHYLMDDEEKMNLDFKNDRITICSFHSMKGLEFDTVFILDNDNDFYEDLSLLKTTFLYIAITRAKSRLVFSYYKNNSKSKLLRILNRSEKLSKITRRSIISMKSHKWYYQ